MKTFQQYVTENTEFQNKKPLINKIYKNTNHITKGMFSDDSWKPVHEFFRTLTSMGLEYVMSDTRYDSENNVPIRKNWIFTINFMNQKMKPDIIYGKIIASGAGSVENPLEKYDLIISLN